jgi:hypothetical protein
MIPLSPCLLWQGRQPRPCRRPAIDNRQLHHHWGHDPLVNLGGVNGSGFQFLPPQNARFFANAARNVYFKKSVKYNFKTSINDKRAKLAASLKPQLSK